MNIALTPLISDWPGIPGKKNFFLFGIMPRLLIYIVAIYLIIMSWSALFGPAV